jgi:hypothetical protein
VTDTLTAVAGDAMLIDRFLPTFAFDIVESVVIDADVATTWRALLDTDLMQVHTPLMDAAFWVRGLPVRVTTALGRTPPAAPPPASLKLGGEIDLEGWVGLGTAEQREVAFGAVGRFWEPNITWKQMASPEEFAAFDEPGWGKIAANFSLRPYGAHRTLLSYEARTATPDPDSRRRFARYWRLVRPFVGHIMRAALHEVRAIAERR